MSRHKLECDVYADGAELTKRRRARGARDLKFAWGAREKAKAKEMAEAESFEEGDLLAEMALCWNKESKNPTVTQMMAQMRAKREKAAKEGSTTGRLRQAEGDDPDDEQAGAPAPWADKPAPYAELMGARAASKPAKAGFFESLLGGGGAKAAVEPAREPAAAPAESRELPAWSAEPLAAKALAELEGIAWGRSRWGFPRLFALDKEGRKVARWTFGGRCVAGRREPPALPNAPGSPWMVVAGPREALMSWAHFTKKWEAQPERAPSIAVAFEGADLSALRDWVAPGQSLHCAWSPKDPASLEWAKAKAEELSKLGFKASVYPKEPRPGAVDSAAPEAKRPGAKP